MANRIRHQKKYQVYLVPLAGGLLGFLIGLSGISNHLIFDQSENLLKTKLANMSQEFTALTFTGFRTLFLTYVGISAGLAASNGLSGRNKPE
jgi:hypothetical protein